MNIHFLEVTTQVRRQIEELTLALTAGQDEHRRRIEKISEARTAIALSSQPAEEKWNSQNRRRGGRFQCAGSAEVSLSPELPALSGGIADLSKEGCRFVINKPHQLRREDPVEISFKVNSMPFRVRATVKSVRSSGVFVGMAFRDVSPRIARLLDDLIDELETASEKLAASAPARASR